jgi:phage terminase Nu1 subunit (DNA packaging protein)
VAANVEWKQASTELIRLRIRKETGELLPVDDVRDVWGRVVRGIRQFVMSLPGKIAFEVPTLTNHDRGVIERICRDALEDASLGRGFDIAADTDDADIPSGETGSDDAGAAAPARGKCL